MMSVMDTLSEYIQMQCYIMAFTLNSSLISFDYMLNCTKPLRVAVIKNHGLFLTSNLNLVFILILSLIKLERCMVMFVEL